LCHVSPRSSSVFRTAGLCCTRSFGRLELPEASSSPRGFFVPPRRELLFAFCAFCSPPFPRPPSAAATGRVQSWGMTNQLPMKTLSMKSATTHQETPPLGAPRISSAFFFFFFSSFLQPDRPVQPLYKVVPRSGDTRPNVNQGLPVRTVRVITNFVLPPLPALVGSSGCSLTFFVLR